jgi:hypothetical protein
MFFGLKNRTFHMFLTNLIIYTFVCVDAALIAGFKLFLAISDSEV